MKRIHLFLGFIILFLFGFSQVQVQDKIENQEELWKQKTGNFYKIQKSFNDYWDDKNIVDGYYDLNGEKIKAYGWKQFKRWEWFWESRIDLKTGDFPTTSRFYQSQKSNLKSGGLGNWISLGPTTSDGGYHGIGRINYIAFDPLNNDVIYAGGASGGIWKSTTGGNNWIPLSDNIGALGISDIIVLDNGTIYIATGDRDAADNYSVGVLKSLDGGITWNTTGLNWEQKYGRRIYRLIINPNDNNILYAATSYGLYKTTNSGLSWTRISDIVFSDLEFKTDNPDIIYGGTRTGGDIYVINNDNFTLSLDSEGYRVEIGVSPDNPQIIYALISNSGSLFGIYKSTNGGASFTEIHGATPNMLDWNCSGSGTGGQAWYDLCIAVNPNNIDDVYIGGINTWKSSDGGLNWTIKNVWSGSCGGTVQEVHADKHFLGFQNNSSILFEGNDGGIYKTENLGDTWIDLTNDMAISQFYRLGVSESSVDLIGGLQDNGTKSKINGEWKDVIGGDGMECTIDPNYPNVQYGELYYGQIKRTENYWLNSTNITSSIGEYGSWVTPYMLDPNNPSTIYVGYKDVWKRDFNNDTGWSKISNFGSYNLRSIAIAPSNSDVICVADQTDIYRTTDGGVTWTAITRPANNTITYIAIDNDDENHFWLTFGQYSANCVYETYDGGLTWTNISAGLPDIPTNCIVQNKYSKELYVGTDIGVYIKIGNNNWELFSNNLPNVVVTELEIYYNGGKILAATYGRGMWQSDLYQSTETPPISNFTADKTYTKIGQEIQFNDISTNNPTSWLWIFEGGTPTTSASQNPKITYSNFGTFNVTLTVANEYGSNTKTINDYITIRDVIAFINNEFTMPDAPQNQPYNNSILNKINYPEDPSVSFSKISGSSWLTVDENGNIHGTPTESGDYTFVIRVQDEYGDMDDATMNISVNLEYCMPIWNSSSQWIESTNFDGTTFQSGNNGGYNDFTNQKIVVGSNFNLTLTPGFIDRSKFEYWNVWVDFNSDGDFTDFGEHVFEASKSKQSIVKNINFGEFEGLARMRISMSTISISSPCAIQIYGEFEDYLIEVEGGSPVFEYCEPISIDNTDYINSININGNYVQTGRGESGYVFYSENILNLVPNVISYTLEPSNSTNRNFWRIWIDFNSDGDFDDLNEEVLVLNNKKGTVSGTILIPYGDNETRLRIAMKNKGEPTPCENNFNGEIEDYTVIISESLIINKKDINIYPNPFDNNLIISNGEYGSIVKIYDLFGRELLIHKIESDYDEINVSNLSNGMYILIVDDYIKKIIKN